MKSHYIKCSVFVQRMAKKHNVKPLYVWDILEEELNLIKGLGCVMTLAEMEWVEKIIIENQK